MLPREEYVEQAYFFRTLLERLNRDITLQDLLDQTRHELLATAKLPMAIEMLSAELKHRGVLAKGMEILKHYFSSFQIFLVAEAERDAGRFDFRTALKILQFEADYRAQSESRQGFFFFQFETICRNRLSYDRGLKAMSEDPAYDKSWSEWLLIVRRQLGLIDLADLIYVRSEEYEARRQRQHGGNAGPPEAPLLFGAKEGKIAVANHKKDPLFLFAAMQRHLGYPPVPRVERADPLPELVPQLMRRVERLESRLKLMEEEQKQGIDITKFYSGSQKKFEFPDDEP
jgi:hypothetical protein